MEEQHTTSTGKRIALPVGNSYAECGCGFYAAGPPDHVESMFSDHECTTEGGFWSNSTTAWIVLAAGAAVAFIISAIKNNISW